MRNYTYLLALVLALYSCSSSTKSSESKDASEDVVEKVAEAIEANNASLAYDLLLNHEFSDGKLKLSDDVILWYHDEPNFKSWFISKAMIQEGPSYFYKLELVIKDLTAEIPGTSC